jgi:hypothetical protein
MPVAFATSVMVADHSSNVSSRVEAKKLSSGNKVVFFIFINGNLSTSHHQDFHHPKEKLFSIACLP